MRSSAEIDGVADECLNLLIVYFTYVETLNNFEPNSGTRFDFHRWWVYLRVLENDLIMRLCRFDDDDRTNHSLREALRSIRNTISIQELTAIEKRIKEYRQLINPLKTKSRNYFLAHMSKNANAIHDPRGGLEKPVEEIVNIIDMITGDSVRYILSVGTQENQIDLRKKLSKKLYKN